MSFTILDIESCCRVCLQVNETNIEVFNEVQEYNMSICDLLRINTDMMIDANDIYPKTICDECLRELLIVAKFKEKIKHSEDTFSRLIIDDKINSSDFVDSDGIIVIPDQIPDEFNFIKEEVKELDDNVSESYEEVEFLDLNGQGDTISGVHVVTMSKCDEDGYIDEIIEECSLVESDLIAHVEEDDQASDQTVNFSSHSNGKKSSPKQTSQELHLSPSDSKVVINFNCVYCGAGFMHSSNLKRHLATHSNTSSEPFPISLDESNGMKKLKFGDITESHVTSVGKKSKKNVIKPHKCEHCDRAFVSRSLLSSHNRTHTGERPFSCNQCNKSFATQGGLDLHTRRHLGLKNYVCNICERRFVESSNLKVHMRTHTGERPHRCNRCNRSFSRVFLLQIHQRTHTGERPFACSECDKCFAQQGDLSAHKRIHSGERPHQCDVCFKRFIKSSALTSHKRRHNEKVIYEDLAEETQENICVV